MKTKALFFSVVLLTSLCTTVGKVQAQKPGSDNTSKPGNGNGPGGGNNGNGNGNAPIDGGLSLLLAAGIGAGAKKAYDKRKAKRQEATA